MPSPGWCNRCGLRMVDTELRRVCGSCIRSNSIGHYGKIVEELLAREEAGEQLDYAVTGPLMQAARERDYAEIEAYQREDQAMRLLIPTKIKAGDVNTRDGDDRPQAVSQVGLLATPELSDGRPGACPPAEAV